MTPLKNTTFPAVGLSLTILMIFPSFTGRCLIAGSVLRIFGSSFMDIWYFSRRSAFSFSLNILCFGTNEWLVMSNFMLIGMGRTRFELATTWLKASPCVQVLYCPQVLVPGWATGPMETPWPGFSGTFEPGSKPRQGFMIVLAADGFAITGPSYTTRATAWHSFL